jgi:hypothetical protein
MATPAQIQANRLNAQKSTGPRSAEGKAASRFNALKHARDAESLVIPGEDPDALAELTAEYYDQFQPEGPLERYYVDSMINADWLRRRLRRSEAELYRALTEGDESETPLGQAWQRDAAGPNALTKLFRQLTALDRNYHRAIAELRQLQATRLRDPLEDEIELLDASAAAFLQSAARQAQPLEDQAPPRQIGFVPQPQNKASRPTAASRPTNKTEQLQ